MPYVIFMLIALALLVSLFYTPAQGEPAAWGKVHGTYIPPEQLGGWE